jgi:RNA polymerase sigma-70 factor (ECF subfamily)
MPLSKLRSTRRKNFEELALPHLDAVYGTALRLTRNPRDAEDLAQEAMLRAYRFWETFEDETNCKAWLLKIVTNTFINHYQKTKRSREVLSLAKTEQETRDGVLFQESGPEQRGPEAMMIENSFSDDVAAALQQLPPEFRVAVVLCDVEGLTYKEVADAMDCPVGTVMSRIFRGRKLLKSALEKFAATQGIVAADKDVIRLDQRRPKPGSTG